VIITASLIIGVYILIKTIKKWEKIVEIWMA
jgi:hypothetical protein